MSLIERTLETLQECILKNTHVEVETERLELKDLSGGDWKQLYITACAFLNANGGMIIIGIKEINNQKDKLNNHYKFTGFKYDDENKLKEISKQFTDAKGNHLNLENYFPDFEIKDFNGGKVAIVYVEKLPEDEKFVFYNNIAYKRILTGDQKLNANQLNEQEELKTELIYAQELSIVDNSNLDLLNVDKLNEYIIQLNRGKKVENVKADLDTAIPFLTRKGFIRNKMPTLLGMLVCGDFVEDYIQGKCEVDCYVESKNKIADDKQIYKENIIDLITKSVGFVFRNTKDGIVSQKGGSVKPEYPEDLVREVVNNALAHRDYKSNRFIIIEIKPNQSLMIQNPGVFKKNQLIHDDKPEGKIRRIVPIQNARNPKLTDLLKSFDRWEGKGKGLASLTDACLENLINLPYYILNIEEIKLYIPTGKIYDDKMEIWLNSFSGHLQHKYGRELNEEEKIIMSYFYKSEEANRLDRYTILLTSDNNHKNVISNLEEKGLLIKNTNSPEIYPIYIVDRILKTDNFTEELKLIFNDHFLSLPEIYKDVLKAVYKFTKFGNQNEIISANNIGNFLYFNENKHITDSRKFDSFKRSIRIIFNNLEYKKFIKRKNGLTKLEGGKPNFVINYDFSKEDALF